jgi:SPP1 family phage portal protein
MQKNFTLPEGSLPSKKLIEEAIAYNDKFCDGYEFLDNYYIGHHRINNRTKSIAYKNNKIMVNHCKYITDMNTAYLIGNPVDYQTLGDLEPETIEPVLELYRKQTISDKDVAVANLNSKMGIGYDYTFIGKKGDVKTEPIDPRNAIVVYDDTLERTPLWGILYKRDGRQLESVMVVTSGEVIQYNPQLVETDRQSHFFGEVPLNEYWNNDEAQGDYEQIISLVDAYEFLTSDRINDKEQLVESILVLKGFGLEESQREDLLTYRMLQNLPTDGTAEYIAKMFNETQIEILRKAIESDIHKISMTPNMSDENFVGNSSGVAIAYKLLPFEQSIKNKERTMEAGLKRRFQLYVNHLAFLSKMKYVEVHDIDVIFKRNLPKNDYETSQMINNLRGVVSPETLISQLTFVKDPSEEIERAREGELAGYNVELPEFGTPDATLESLEEKGLVEASAKQDSLLNKLKNLMSGQ